ncbi:LysM peptidoglycan-binding domain-containing protein [Cellulomonas sp. P5_C5]
MLVDIVQTFDEQAFDLGSALTRLVERYPGQPGRAGTRDVMSAMVMGPAMPNRVSNRVSNPVSSRTANRVAVSAAPRAHVSAPSAAHLRLTARGRAVLWILAAVAVVLTNLVASQASADGPVSAQEVVRHVVQPGETLWQIAESVAAPSEDVRDVVVDLVRLNELPEAGLMAGQVIVVPAS